MASVLGIVAIHENEVIPAGTKIKITGGSTIDAVGGTCTDSSVTESKYSRYYLIPRAEPSPTLALNGTK